MATTSKHAWVLMLTIALGCNFTVAQAANSKLEEIQAKKQAQREAAAKQAVLTQTEVDRLVATIPVIHATLPKLDLPELNDGQQKAFSIASLNGQPTAKMVEFIADTDALVALDAIAQEHNYADYLGYAQHFDIAFGVLTAEQWIMMSRGIVIKDEEPPAPIDNLWEFIHDESQPKAEREKLSTQLDEMLPKFSTNRGNAEMIYRNLDTLKPLVLGN